MTILVLGDGLLGSTFTRFEDTVVLSRLECDILSKLDVPETLDVYQPDTVINCAGVVPKRGASIRETFKTNAFAPHYLASECHQRDIKLVHISTNCVFKGRDTGYYDETEVSNAVDMYGVSKALGEPDNSLVIRTSFVGLPDPKERGLLAWAENQRLGLVGYDQVYWNGVTTLELVHKIFELLQENATGIRHIYGHTTTKFLLLSLANEVFKWGVEVIPESEAFDYGVHHENKTLTSIYKGGFITKPLKQQLEELRALIHVYPSEKRNDT